MINCLCPGCLHSLTPGGTGPGVQPLCSITSPSSHLICWQMRHWPIRQSWTEILLVPASPPHSLCCEQKGGWQYGIALQGCLGRGAVPTSSPGLSGCILSCLCLGTVCTEIRETHLFPDSGISGVQSGETVWFEPDFASQTPRRVYLMLY